MRCKTIRIFFGGLMHEALKAKMQAEFYVAGFFPTY